MYAGRGGLPLFSAARFACRFFGRFLRRGLVAFLHAGQRRFEQVELQYMDGQGVRQVLARRANQRANLLLLLLLRLALGGLRLQLFERGARPLFLLGLRLLGCCFGRRRFLPGGGV